MAAAAQLIREKYAVDFCLVVPGEELRAVAQELTQSVAGLKLQVGGLADALAESTVALASTGTVTMECALFKVPTVTMYRTNWLTYEIGRRIVTVKSLTMPNLLAGETVFPEFIQNEATPRQIADAALALLESEERREAIRKQLDSILEKLGGPGACVRAADLIWKLR